MPKHGSTTPNIADLITTQNTIPKKNSNVESNNVSNIAKKHDSSDKDVVEKIPMRQLNTRVPADLYGELLSVQAELTKLTGSKPSFQNMIASCLRLGLEQQDSLKSLLETK